MLICKITETPIQYLKLTPFAKKSLVLNNSSDTQDEKNFKNPQFTGKSKGSLPNL